MTERQRVIAFLPWYSGGVILSGIALIIYTYCMASLNNGFIQLSAGLLIAAFFCFIIGVAKLYPIGESVS